jgi:hypothetical protein
MIIRGTSKILKTSGIKPVKNTDEITSELPGEWYAGLVSTGKQGKLAIHFLHHPTMLSVLVNGKSLNKAIPIFQERAEKLIKRLGYGKLLFQYQLQTEPQIFATNSRSMLAHMNQLRYNIEYHLAMAETIEDTNWDYIEEIHYDYIFSRNKKYTRPKDILDGLMKDN